MRYPWSVSNRYILSQSLWNMYSILWSKSNRRKLVKKLRKWNFCTRAIPQEKDNKKKANNETATPYTLSKKYFQAPILVLQLVTNRGLYLVRGRTKLYLEAPLQACLGPQGQKICLSWCFHIPFGPPRYWRVLYLWQPQAPKIGAWKYLFS